MSNCQSKAIYVQKLRALLSKRLTRLLLSGTFHVQEVRMLSITAHTIPAGTCGICASTCLVSGVW